MSSFIDGYYLFKPYTGETAIYEKRGNITYCIYWDKYLNSPVQLVSNKDLGHMTYLSEEEYKQFQIGLL
jgi:hypothetical protein